VGSIAARDGRVGGIVVKLAGLILGHGVESGVGLGVKIEYDGIGLLADGTHGCGIVFQRADVLAVLVLTLWERGNEHGDGAGGAGLADVVAHIVGEGGGGNVLQ
jgi:hypothetical protein